MRALAAVCIAVLMAGPAMAKDRISVPMAFLKQERPEPPTLSNLDPIPEDLALAGAMLGLGDSAKTGKFLGFDYALDEVLVPEGEDVVAAAKAALAETRFLVVDADAPFLTAIADLPEAEGALILNATAQDASLRGDACRANLFHTMPSYSMRADALSQFLVKKQWTRWALIHGDKPGDLAFAEALKQSGKKFRLKLSGEKAWIFDADMRRNAAAEVPLFTQDLGEHHVLVIADEINDFARYVIYNTWLPRPIAGSVGLQPRAWAPVVEQWGAAQLQKRFRRQFERDMRSEDFGAWAAVRAVSEAVTRTKSNDPAVLRAFMLSEDFELGGFKGRPLTFRPWNGQLRQPIPLVHADALAAQAPIEGFLHQHNEMDTLGVDQPNSTCTTFASQ
ncbi:MAG: ABC transporter substrate-binding protein [Pseudomonadota bacterium]